MVQSGHHLCQWEKVEVGVFAGPDLSESGLVLALDAGNVKSSYKNFIKAKVYSVFNGGLRSANYSVQYSDDNINWTTAFSGVCSNNTSCGIQENTGLGNGSYGYRRYWRYVEGSAVVSHHPRVSRIILTDVNGVDYDLIVYASDNCSDTGTYIVGTVSVDFATNIWTDLSGRGNNGTLTNGPTYSSANGGSIVFDGTNDYVNMGNSQAGNFGTSNFSINAFFKFTSTGNNSGIFCKSIGDNPTTIYGWLLNIPDGTELGFAMATTNSGWGSSGSYSCKSTGISINDGNWRMVTIVGDRTQTNISMYINGTLQTLQEYAGGLNLFNTVGNVTNTYNLVLGNESDASHPFNGNIAQASIYNRALTAAEIQQNFNANRSRFGI